MIRDTASLCCCRYGFRLIHQVSIVPGNVSVAMSRLGELLTPLALLVLLQSGRLRVSYLIGGYCGISVLFSRHLYGKQANDAYENIPCIH
jgi:hypothetical protein